MVATTTRRAATTSALEKETTRRPQLEPTTEAPSLSSQALRQIAQFIGEKELPLELLTALEAGDFGALRSFLDAKGLKPNKAQMARFRAAAEAFGIPAGLVEVAEAFFDETLLVGAVKALGSFAGQEPPPEVLDAMEEGDHKPYLDFLAEVEAKPSLEDLAKLKRKADVLKLPPELLAALEDWLTAFSLTSEAPTTTTTPKPTPRPTLPGETTTPPFPLSEAEEKAVKVVQSVGCTVLIGILAGTIAFFALIVQDWSVERVIHLNQEVSLLIAHILILTMRDRTDVHIPCKLTSVALQSLFLTNFVFLAAEGLQSYGMGTTIIAKGGVFNKKQLIVLGWSLPAVYTGCVSMFLHDHYVSWFSCWLNLGHSVAMATIVPIGLLSAATIVMVEAQGMGRFSQLPGTDQSQMTAAVANNKGLLFTLPANVFSWLVGLYSVYEANVALYATVFAANLALALTILAFHTLGNPKVHALTKKLFGK